MIVDGRTDENRGVRLIQLEQIFKDLGCTEAYNFDGGQTSEVLINNERYNYVDWDNEREVSDILYFATAIPEQEVG